MKTLLFSLVALTLANSIAPQVAQAGARPFRVLRPLGNNYAYAWGMKGRSLDFEELDRDSKKAEAFLEQNESKLVNYVVDLGTEEIVAVVNDPAFHAELSDAIIHHNHEYFSLHFLDLGKSDESDSTFSGFVAEEGGKWENGLGSLLVVRRMNHRNSVVQKIENFQRRVEVALTEKISAEDRKAYHELSLASANVLEFKSRAGVSAYSFSNYLYEAKSSDPGYTLKGNFKVRWNNEKQTVEISDVTGVSFVKEPTRQ